MRPGDELAVHARRVIAVPAVGTRVVGGGERADDELPRSDRPHGAAHLLDDAAVFMSHRRGSVDRFKPAIRPQVRPAHAREGDSDDGIGRFDDPRELSLLEPQVARAVEDVELLGPLERGEECGHLPELVALPVGERVVVALGALEFHPQEQPRGAGGQVLRLQLVGLIEGDDAEVGRVDGAAGPGDNAVTDRVGGQQRTHHLVIGGVVLQLLA